jgi:DNA-directed RNA polymerase specialized sigma24 family protein
MRLLEGIPRAECAERIGVTPATFDVVLHRATKAFQKAWNGR